MSWSISMKVWDRAGIKLVTPDWNRLRWRTSWFCSKVLCWHTFLSVLVSETIWVPPLFVLSFEKWSNFNQSKVCLSGIIMFISCVNSYHVEYINLLHSSNFYPTKLQDFIWWHVLTRIIESSVDPDQLASEKPADLDLHCFQNRILVYPGLTWFELIYCNSLLCTTILCYKKVFCFLSKAI